jgi:hypothetical protein
MYKSLQAARPFVLAAACLMPPEVWAAGKEGLRELATDRPDFTESPFTVDAGHAQLEMDFGNMTHDREAGVRRVEWELAPFNVRFGVTANFELGLFVVGYRHVEVTPAGGARLTRAGAGDLTLRAKINFFGNDSGPTAMGLIADLKLPTARRDLGNGAVEGTLLFPVAQALGGGWELAAMTGADIRAKDEGSGRRAVWINTITTGHAITNKVAGYVELTSAVGEGTHVATFNAGLTFKVDEATQYDVGGEVGLSRAADDLKVFAGVSRKF